MREIYLSEIKLLAEAGAVSAATIRGHQGRFLLTFHVGAENMLLIAKAGTPRSFRDLTRAAQLLYELGVRKALLDLEQYGSNQEGPVDQPVETDLPSAVSRQGKNTDPDPEAESLG